MTFTQAFSTRVKQILKEKKLTFYKLEQETGLYHSTINHIMNDKNNTISSKSMALIIRALGLSLSEFFDNPIFNLDQLEIE